MDARDAAVREPDGAPCGEGREAELAFPGASVEGDANCGSGLDPTASHRLAAAEREALRAARLARRTQGDRDPAAAGPVAREQADLHGSTGARPAVRRRAARQPDRTVR